MKIENSVVWITGGTSGIGLETARQLVDRGAKVLITGRNAERGKEAEKEMGDACLFYQSDVTKTDENLAAAQAAVDKWGRLDAHFANAGFPHLFKVFGDDGELTSIDPFVADIQVNLIGVFDTVRIAAYHIKKNEPGETGERGSIVISSSLAAKASTAGELLFGYKTAKEGVCALTRQFAANLAPYAIRVNTVCPGWIRTGMTMNDETNPGVDVNNPIAMQLYPRELGEPSCIADTVLYLFQNEFINRAEISVDAGYLMRT